MSAGVFSIRTWRAGSLLDLATQLDRHREALGEVHRQLVTAERDVLESWWDGPVAQAQSHFDEHLRELQAMQDDLDTATRQVRAAGIETARPEPEAGTAQAVLPGTVVVPPQQLLVVAAPAAGLEELDNGEELA